MVDVATDSHADGTSERFEDAFNLVVFVLSFGLDVQVHASCVREALEEMQEHLGRHLSYPLTMELGIPDEPRATTEVESNGAEAVVHGEGVGGGGDKAFRRNRCRKGIGGAAACTKTITLDTTFVAKSLQERFAKGEGGVFDGVVLVDMEVATNADVEVDAAVLGYLLEHVVEEAEASGDRVLARAVEVEGDVDIGLARGSLNSSRALACVDDSGYLLPIHIIAENQGFAAQVRRQLCIRMSVADDIAAAQVACAVGVGCKHRSPRLARRQVVFGEATVDENIVERHSFACQNLKHQVVRRPKISLGVAVGPQSILIRHHHEAIVGVLTDEAERTNDTGHEVEFLERVNLFVGRLLQNSAVAVDE